VITLGLIGVIAGKVADRLVQDARLVRLVRSLHVLDLTRPPAVSPPVGRR
jgi:hypothetical protein